MIHLALLADAALLLVVLRMIHVGADRECPREFFFLLSLLCYALLSFAPSFPAWGHAAIWLTSAPLLIAAGKEFPSRRAALMTVLALCAAATLGGPTSVARWGNSPAASWALLGSYFAFAAGIVLLFAASHEHAALKGAATSRARLRAGIGAHLLTVYGAALAGVPFPATVFAATLIWLVTAAFLAPTPGALLNEERLALSTFNLPTFQPSTCSKEDLRG